MPYRKTDRWRVIVRLKSLRALTEYKDFHKLSGRELARRADEVAKKKGGSVGPGIVGHLLAGRRDTCSLITATSIEEALQCPPGFLFEPSLSPVADTSRHMRAAS